MTRPVVDHQADAGAQVSGAEVELPAEASAGEAGVSLAVDRGDDIRRRLADRLQSFDPAESIAELEVGSALAGRQREGRVDAMDIGPGEDLVGRRGGREKRRRQRRGGEDERAQHRPPIVASLPQAHSNLRACERRPYRSPGGAPIRAGFVEAS